MRKLRINTNEKGFTLIELMIVIAIIGILAAIAIPNFIAYRDKSFCSAAESDATPFFVLFGPFYYFSRHFYIAVFILNLTPALVLHNIPFHMQITLFVLTFVIFSLVSVKTCFLVNLGLFNTFLDIFTLLCLYLI